jgi:ABC-type multidrug transport system ATPase subunit
MLISCSLGGSGSGKTTLLNAVAHRISGLPITGGEVGYYAASRRGDEIEGRKLSRGEVKKRTGFVRQQDFLVECLTGMFWLVSYLIVC